MSRKIAVASRSMDASVVLFADAESVDERLSILAEFAADAWTWRREESDRMRAMEQRLGKSETVIEDNGGGSYLMPK